MMTLQPIAYENLDAVLKMQLSQQQQRFVLDNAHSLAEAYLALARGEAAMPFAICDDNCVVGFIMFSYGSAGYEGEPAIADGNYSIWRLMIDEPAQGKGYGRASMQLALEYLRTWPCGPAKDVWLSVHPENKVARHLYASFGFVENGEMSGNEVVMVRPLL